MSLNPNQLLQLVKYIKDAGGSYTDSKWGKVLGGWKAVDLVGSAGSLDNANGAWTAYGGLEGTYKASGNLQQFQQGVAALLQQHMHHPPNFTKAIGGAVGSVAHAASSVGKVFGNVASAVGKIPGFSVALNAIALAVPGVDVVAAGYDAVQAAVKVGNMVTSKSPVAAAAQQAVSQTLGPSGAAGFQAAAGAMTQPGVGPVQIAALRSALPDPQAQQGFDAAMALNAGSASGPTPPSNLSPAAKAGWLTTHGAVQTHMPSVLGPLAATPGTAQGAAMAATQLNVKHASWWHRLFVKMHLAKDVAPNTAALQTSPAVAASGSSVVSAKSGPAAALAAPGPKVGFGGASFGGGSMVYVQLVQNADGSTMDIVRADPSLLPMINQAAGSMGASVNTAATVNTPSLASQNLNTAADAQQWLNMMASGTVPTSDDQLDD